MNLGAHAEARPLLLRAAEADAAPRDRVVLYRHLLLAERALSNLYGARAALLGLTDNGADPQEIASSRAALQPWEVDNALSALRDADGTVHLPSDGADRSQARHVEEMRHALASFVEHAASDDPRRAVLRRALER